MTARSPKPRKRTAERRGGAGGSQPPRPEPPAPGQPSPKRVVHPEDDQFIHRGWQVRNTLQYHLAVLCTPGYSEKSYSVARECIDAAWKALARRDVSTGKKIRLMREIDQVAKSALQGAAAGHAVVDSLPPELARPFAPLASRLGELVEAWRDRKGGHGTRVGKFWLCAAIWLAATGQKTSSDALERFWKKRGHLHP